MLTERPVAIVVPLEEELVAYRSLLGGMKRLGCLEPWEAWEAEARSRLVVLVLSDCGPTNAGAATERAIALLNPVAVLVGGSAGAHSPELLPGDVVVGSACCILYPPEEQEGRERRGVPTKRVRFRLDGGRVHVDSCLADPALVALAERIACAEAAGWGPWADVGWPECVARRRAKVVVGRIGSADAWTDTRDGIEALRARYHTECEDMESAFVAQVCAMHRLPCLAARAISNNELLQPLGSAQVGACVLAAGRRAASVLARLAGELDPAVLAVREGGGRESVAEQVEDA
jgi:nucleoside phosphorylase